MRWKLVLVALIIVGILGVMFFSDTGITYFDVLKGSVGNFFAVVFKWGPPSRFYVTLTADKEIFYGQVYKISNASFSGFGTAKQITINKASSPVNQIDVDVQGIKGSFEMTRQRSVKISGDANNIVLNTFPFSSVNIFIDMVPTDFSLSQFSQDKFVFPSVTGQIKTEEGWSKDLNDAYVEIYGFVGTLRLAGDNMVLEGLTTKFVVDGKEVVISSK